MNLKLYTTICLIIFILINSLSYAMEEEEFWNTSLNVGISNKKISFNKWHKDAQQYLNDENRGIIQSKFEKTEGIRNIASFRFFLLYQVEGSTGSAKFALFNPSIIFISGLSKFNNALLTEKNEQHLRNKIKNPRSFQDENLDGPTITNYQYQALVPLIGAQQLNNIYGNQRKGRVLDAEGSIIRFLSCKIPDIIQAICSQEINKVTIIGSILQISSLFDPCDYCLPLLKQYGINLRNIINEKRAFNLQSRISVKEALETLFLISGNQVYGTSRNNVIYHNKNIDFNVNNPKFRMILAKIEDLQDEVSMDVENFIED